MYLHGNCCAIKFTHYILVLWSNFLCILRVFFYHYCALSRWFLLNYLLTLRVFSSLNSECILYPSMHRSSPNYYLQYEFHHYNASQSHSSIRHPWSSSSSQVFCNLKTIVDFIFFPSLIALLSCIMNSSNTGPLLQQFRGDEIFRGIQHCS